MTCPGFERLIDHLDGRLEAAAAETVAAHLAAGCQRCISDQTWYESVRRVTAADDSIAPPLWVLKMATRIFESERNRPALSARLGSIVAALVFDSRRGPVLAGVRTTQWVDHQFLYRADDFKIDLRLESSGQRVNLRGQILREGESLFESTSGASLELIRDGKPVHSTCTNQVGEFTIPAIESGRYDLRIEAGGVSITVPALPIV